MSYMRPNNAYLCQLPMVAAGVTRFKHVVTVQSSTYNFEFILFKRNPEGDSQYFWYFYVTGTNGFSNSGMVTPNAINFSESNDIGVVFVTNLVEIGENDLSNISMYIMQWL